MRHQYWRGWDEGEVRGFFEKAYCRQSLPAWDARWERLSLHARYSFLHVVKLPDPNPYSYGGPRFTPRDNFPPHVLEELAAAGFVQIEFAKAPVTIDRVVAGNGTTDFAWRCRILRRMHLLDPDRPCELSKYVDEAFFVHDLMQSLSAVLQQVGITG